VDREVHGPFDPARVRAGPSMITRSGGGRLRPCSVLPGLALVPLVAGSAVAAVGDFRSHSPPTTTATRSGRGCVLLRQGRACSRRSRSGSARCRVSASSDGGPGRTSRRADAARDSGRHRWGRHDPASGTDAACTRDGPRASIPGLRERSPGERPWRENRHRPGGGSRRHTDSRPWYHYAGRDGIIPKGNVPTVARILPVWLP